MHVFFASDLLGKNAKVSIEKWFSLKELYCSLPILRLIALMETRTVLAANTVLRELANGRDRMSGLH